MASRSIDRFQPHDEVIFPIPTRAEAGAGRFSLNDAIPALRHHAWMIVAFGAVGLAVGLGIFLTVKPSFTAEGALVLDARRPRLADLPSLVSEQTTNPEAPQLRSEVEILQSPDLAARVITQLGLLRDATFHTGPSFFRRTLTWVMTKVTDRVPQVTSWLVPRGGAGGEANILTEATQTYLSNLVVSNDGRSYVIRVRFRSYNPQLAANIVNAHVQAYLNAQKDFKNEIGRQATLWLTSELANLQNKLRTAEEQVQRFREEKQIVQSGGTTLLSQQLAAVNAQLPVAEGELSTAMSRLKQAKSLAGKDRIETESTVLESRAIQGLREQQAELLRRQAELETSYGPQHPSVTKIRAQAGDLQHQIRAETERIIASRGNDVEVARNHVTQLRAHLDDLVRQTVVAGREEGRLHDLEREVAADNSLIEVLLARFKQVSVQEPVQQADARIITMAAVPSEPSFPKLRVLIPGGGAFGVLLGAVIALMRELFRSGFKGSQDIELECELPSLGSVPMVPAVWFKTLPPQDALLDRPRSGFTEAVAAVRTAMQASLSGGDAAKTFLITSSLPGEGKTTLAISLGRSFAESGRRTLLLDCDNRQASIVAALSNPAERAGGSRQPGITSILRDRVPWREAIRKDHRSRLYYIPAGPSANAPQDLFTSSAARQFLEAARQEFDVILIDSPPITAVPDALILSRLVDATMLVVRWGATPREIAKTSLNKLLMNGARLCGVVLMAVDMRRGVFSLADPEYYQRHNQKYYVS